MDNRAKPFLDDFIQKPQISRAIWLLSIVIGVLGIIYFFWKNLFIRWEDFDFKVIWLSGHLWLQGISPYSDQFVNTGYQLFETFNGQPFYYPAHFSLVSTVFALFEFEVAMELWRWFNINLFLLSSLVLKSALSTPDQNLSWRRIFFYTGMIGFMQSVILIFHLGQTTILIYFGLCLIIYGLSKRNDIALIIGLCIALLKPQVGIPLMAALLPFKEYHKPLLLTCVAMVIVCLPATLPLGVIETIFAYMKGISAHGEFYPNHPKVSTGIRNIIYLLFEYELSSTIFGITTIFIVFVASFFMKVKLMKFAVGQENELMIMIVTMAITIITVFSPLHTYDFLILAPVFLLSWRFESPYKIWMFMLFLVIVRYNNITRETSFLLRAEEQMIGNELVTFTAAFMLVIIMITIRNSIRFKSLK